MNIKRFFLTSIVVYIAMQLIGFVVHNLILSSTYQTLTTVWRPDMMDKLWIMYITSAIFSFTFVYIFIRGYQNKGLMEGVRYALIIGFMMNALASFTQYALYPLPLSLCVQWFVYGMIEFVIYGLIVAAIYKKN
jgi:hypothetical protein